MTKNIKMFSVAVLIALAVCLMPAMSVFGYEQPDPDRAASLTMTLRSTSGDARYVSDAEITLYKVADCTVDEDTVLFGLAEDYSASGLDLYGKITQSKIDELVKYTDSHKITGLTGMSDSKGMIIFDGLECGVYLVTATSLPDGFTSFVPFLYFLPFYDQDGGTWVYDGVAEPKISYLQPVDIKVKKVWNDDGKTRPDSVTIQLENEDGVYDTVLLNSANNWKYEWKNMRADKDWNVKEINIPADYKATYAAEGFDFTVTNTSQLVQTGQVQWPVPVLVFAGAFLVCAGIIVKVPSKRKDEE